jgi:hypothetical protein
MFFRMNVVRSGGRLDSSEGETHGAPSLTLERSVHGTGVVDEVAAGPWVAHEEVAGKHVGLEPITWRAGRDDVPLIVRSAFGERMHVIERRAGVVERRCAVHAAAPAIAHGGKLDRPLLLSGEDAPDAAHDAA